MAETPLPAQEDDITLEKWPIPLAFSWSTQSTGGSGPRPAMIIRHMINTPIEMPAINPKEKCSIPATLLLSASSAAGKKTLTEM
jgi:hypothetical protein